MYVDTMYLIVGLLLCLRLKFVFVSSDVSVWLSMQVVMALVEPSLLADAISIKIPCPFNDNIFISIKRLSNYLQQKKYRHVIALTKFK